MPSAVFRRTDGEPTSWPRGPFSSETWLHVTDDELAEFAAEIAAVMTRWAERELPDDGRDRETVFAFARAVPGQP